MRRHGLDYWPDLYVQYISSYNAVIKSKVNAHFFLPVHYKIVLLIHSELVGRPINSKLLAAFFTMIY